MFSSPSFIGKQSQKSTLEDGSPLTLRLRQKVEIMAGKNFKVSSVL
jgi:hypothetical protein